MFLAVYDQKIFLLLSNTSSIEFLPLVQILSRGPPRAGLLLLLLLLQRPKQTSSDPVRLPGHGQKGGHAGVFCNIQRIFFAKKANKMV